MKKLRNRLIFHFSLQFVTLSISIALIVLILFFSLANYISNDEMKRNMPVGALEGIITDTEIVNDKATISIKWRELLEPRDMWVQVINNNGHEIGGFNIPAKIPSTYNLGAILQIEESQELLGFTTLSEVDNSYEEPYYFILGYKDKNKEKLLELFHRYNENGLIRKNDLHELQLKVESEDTILNIVNNKGEILQTFGENDQKTHSYKPLDFLLRKQEPGLYELNTSFYHDVHSKNTWVYLSPKKEIETSSITILEKFMIAIIIMGASVFLVTISLSIWNGYRYGQPLFIFTSWLERMGKRQYDEVLTEKERHRIFRKNGKVRTRYRLYREVINAFYEMTERLSASEKEKRKLEKTREEWMTGISHDLRTPLSSIQGYGHILGSGQYQWSNEELIDIGTTIVEKSNHMLHLVEDFTLTFQLKNNALSLSMEKKEINHLVGSIVSKFTKDLTLKEYQFYFFPNEYSSYIHTDPKWFERMLDNIIFNSIKHNPNDTKITISIHVNEIENEILLEVKDSGIGMDEQTMSQLFERYYRGTNTDMRIEGAGLGMNIAKGIADLHSATIQVNSKINNGTTILIAFPFIKNNE